MQAYNCNILTTLPNNNVNVVFLDGILCNLFVVRLYDVIVLVGQIPEAKRRVIHNNWTRFRPWRLVAFKLAQWQKDGEWEWKRGAGRESRGEWCCVWQTFFSAVLTSGKGLWRVFYERNSRHSCYAIDCSVNIELTWYIVSIRKVMLLTCTIRFK